MSTFVHVPATTITGPLEPIGQRPGTDSGDPQLGILRFETAGAVRAGVWECEPGGWPVENREDTETLLHPGRAGPHRRRRHGQHVRGLRRGRHRAAPGLVGTMGRQGDDPQGVEPALSSGAASAWYGSARLASVSRPA
jgi:hypothetical protein